VLSNVCSCIFLSLFRLIWVWFIRTQVSLITDGLTKNPAYASLYSIPLTYLVVATVLNNYALDADCKMNVPSCLKTLENSDGVHKDMSLASRILEDTFCSSWPWPCPRVTSLWPCAHRSTKFSLMNIYR